ncbi:hypothetical protein CARUB_v100032510mg, partial [Capsella rubella]
MREEEEEERGLLKLTLTLSFRIYKNIMYRILYGCGDA